MRCCPQSMQFRGDTDGRKCSKFKLWKPAECFYKQQMVACGLRAQCTLCKEVFYWWRKRYGYTPPSDPAPFQYINTGHALEMRGLVTRPRCAKLCQSAPQLPLLFHRDTLHLDASGSYSASHGFTPSR